MMSFEHQHKEGGAAKNNQVAPSSTSIYNSNNNNDAAAAPPTTNSSTTTPSFEESYASQQLRLFWDAQPFSVVEAIMDKILLSSTTEDPLAVTAHPEEQTPLLLLLEPLVQTSSTDNEKEQNGCSLRNTDTKASCHVFQNFYQGRLMDYYNDTSTEEDDDDKGTSCSPSLYPTERSGKHNFRLDLAYKGSDFCGWQRQGKKQSVRDTSTTTTTTTAATTTIHDNPSTANGNGFTRRRPLPSVQEVIEAALNNRDVRVAGRTDAGVHAFGQVARVRCETHVSLQQVQQKLQRAAVATSSQCASSWKCWRVVAVDIKFHPSFGAASRSYAYVLDGHVVQSFFGNDLFQISQTLNEVLQPLVGQALDYYAFSYGKIHTQSSLCTLHHARVRVAAAVANQKKDKNNNDSTRNKNSALIVELTGDRFLRRQVRKLVATALRCLLLPTSEHSGDAPNMDTSSHKDSSSITRSNLGDALLKIVQSKDRRESAKAAPPNGLILVGAEMKNKH
jgi:tRNA pseudouridine(38-40) synthase